MFFYVTLFASVFHSSFAYLIPLIGFINLHNFAVIRKAVMLTSKAGESN